MKISPAEWNDDAGQIRLEAFKNDVIERMAQAPWNNDYAKVNNKSVS